MQKRLAFIYLITVQSPKEIKKQTLLGKKVFLFAKVKKIFLSF